MQNHIKQRPQNIIFILADDLGYGDIGCYGATKLQTPNIDSLAKGGIRFTDAHSPSSVCSPSRYNLMTGRYCWRTWASTGCIWANDPLVIEDGQMTIASLLQEEGYYTGLIGKWHLGFGRPGSPNWDDTLGPDFNKELKPGPRECGFDYFYGMPAVSQHPNVFVENHTVQDIDLDDPIELHRDPRPEFLVNYDQRPRTYNIVLKMSGGKQAQYDFDEGAVILTEKAVSFINEHREEPFFLLYSPRNIHAPIRPHPRFKGTSECGLYGDFIHELDWSVGEILQALEQNQLTENTLIIFSSDNGAVAEGHKPAEYVNHLGHMSNGSLRGQKTEIWEGGHRVPFIAKWPGRIKPGTTSAEMIALTDMLASFAALLGRELPGDAGQDSCNILPAVLGEKIGDKPLRETLVNDSWKGHLSIRRGPWKLIMGQGGGGIGWEEESNGGSNSQAWQLYNLDEDLFELNNLYEARPDIVRNLTESFERIKNQK